MPVTLGEVIVRFGAETAGFNSGVAGMMTRLGGLGAMMTAAGVVAGTVLVGGLIAAGVASVKLGADFQQGVTRLVTGAGDVTDNMQKMGKGILATSVATGVLTTGADGLNAAMYQIISSGQRGAQALNTLTVSAQAAQVEQANVVDVAKAVSTAMTDYGTHIYNASQYTNGFIAAVAHGKLTLEELSTAMSPIMPITQELGVSFADTAAAMATMTNAGLPATVAATGLKFLLQSLIAPTVKANKAFNEWGVDTTKLAETMKTSLPDALQMIYNAALKAGPTMSKPFNDAVDSMIGGQRSLRAFLDLTGSHLDTYRQNVQNVLTAMNNGKNVIQGWALAQGNFNVQMDRAHAVIEATAITLGSRLLPVLTPIVSRFVDWAAGMGKVIAHMDFSGLATAIQGIADRVGGLFENLGKFANFTINSQSWRDAATAIGGAANQVGIFGSKVAAVINQNDQLTTALKGTWNEMGTTVAQAAGPVQDFFTMLNYLGDSFSNQAMKTDMAFLLLGEAGKTSMMSVSDASRLLGMNIKLVSDSTTGATIDLQKYVRTADLSGSTTVTLAQALQLVGKSGDGFLTVADYAKLLTMRIGNVQDATNGVTIDVKNMAHQTGIYLDMAQQKYQQWLAYLVSGGTQSFEAWSAADQKATETFLANEHSKQNGLGQTMKVADNLQARLLKLNEPHDIPVKYKQVIDAGATADQTRAKLLKLNDPHDIPINTSHITDAQMNARNLEDALRRSNGPFDPIINSGHITDAQMNARHLEDALRRSQGPFDPVVGTASIAQGGQAADTLWQKLHKLNDPVAPVVNTGSIAQGGQAADDMWQKLHRLNDPVAPVVFTGSIDNATAHAKTTHSALLALNGSSTWNASLVGGVYNASGIRGSLLALNGSSTWYANLVNTTTNISRTVMMARGGVITEHIVGVGLSTGTRYELGESGNELVIPLGGAAKGGGLTAPQDTPKNAGSTNNVGSSAGARLTHILERLEHLLSSEPRVSEFQIAQALGRLLSNGVR